MKPLRNILLLLIALHLLPGAAQTPQGLGRNIRAVASTPEGLVAITDEAKVLRSSDQWVTYTTLVNLRAAEDDDLLNLYAIAARGSRVVVGGGESLLYTADLSADPIVWSPQNDTSDLLFGDVYGIAVSDTGTWIAVGDGGILRSEDALEWDETLNSLETFKGVIWVSGDNWVAVGTDGIWRSTNDGETWSQVPGVSGSFTAAASDGQDNVLAVGENGKIVLSDNEGASFTELQTDGEQLRSVVATGENTWAIGGWQRTLLLLDDQGALSEESLIGFEEASEDEVLGLIYEDGTLMMAGVEEIPAPEFDADNDPNNPVEVTLTQTDDDTILYTTDGSDPRTDGIEYTAPFTVTGTVTVQAVAERDGVFSPVVSQEIEAGEDLEPFSIESITFSGNTVTLIQDVSTNGYTYGLEYTADLGATPQVWTSETDAEPLTQAGITGEAPTWEISPVPASPRFWRIVIVP